MAGGATTVALVAESSRAGVLGSLGAAYLSAAQIEQAAGAIRERTDRPYAINLFASVPDQPYRGDGARLLALMARYHAQLGLDAPAMPGPQADPLATQIEAVLRARRRCSAYLRPHRAGRAGAVPRTGHPDGGHGHHRARSGGAGTGRRGRRGGPGL